MEMTSTSDGVAEGVGGCSGTAIAIGTSFRRDVSITTRMFGAAAAGDGAGGSRGGNDV